MQNQFRFEIATVEDFKVAVECINQTFCQGEALSKAINLSLDEFRPFVEIFTKRSIQNGHTYLAKDGEGKVIGCLVAEDFLLPPPEGSDKLDEKLDSVIAILSHLDEEFKKQSSPKLGEILHVLMVGVFPEASGNSIGVRLLELSEKMAKLEGRRGVIAEATGPVSQKIFLKSGYKVLEKVFYNRYQFRGQLVFGRVSDCESCDLVFKAI